MKSFVMFYSLVFGALCVSPLLFAKPLTGIVRDPFALSAQLREKMPQVQESHETSSSTNTDNLLLNGLSIRLKGIVRAKQNVALLRIDGREQFAHKNSQFEMTAVNGKVLAIAVVEIKQDSIKLKIGKQPLTLFVE